MAKIVKKLFKKTFEFYQKIFKKTYPEVKKTALQSHGIIEKESAT